jgi:hypothetical protein
MQYYCDFCKKSGASKFHLANHEKHCTGNPDRECRMCVELNGGQENSLTELIEALGNGGEEGLSRLKEAANNCPMCILSALKQSGINEIDEKTGEPINGGFIFFDYHKARLDAFSDINDSRAIEMYY